MCASDAQAINRASVKATRRPSTRNVLEVLLRLAVPDDKLTSIVRKNFDLTPRAIIDALELRRPIYRASAAYGHFGRPEFSWEKTNKAKDLARSV